MTSDDNKGGIDAAFDKVIPKDDQEREILSRLKKKMLGLNDEIGQVVQGNQIKLPQEKSPTFEDAQKCTARRIEIAREMVSAMTDTFQEHADLIDRIATQLAKR